MNLPLARCLLVVALATIVPACGDGGGGGGSSGNGAGNRLITQNQPPSVTLVKPAPRAVVTTGREFELEANAADIDGSVQNVDFFDGSSRLATVVNSPFRIVLFSLAQGIHSLTARATDNLGATTVS